MRTHHASQSARTQDFVLGQSQTLLTERAYCINVMQGRLPVGMSRHERTGSSSAAAPATMQRPASSHAAHRDVAEPSQAHRRITEHSPKKTRLNDSGSKPRYKYRPVRHRFTAMLMSGIRSAYPSSNAAAVQRFCRPRTNDFGSCGSNGRPHSGQRFSGRCSRMYPQLRHRMGLADIRTSVQRGVGRREEGRVPPSRSRYGGLRDAED